MRYRTHTADAFDDVECLIDGQALDTLLQAPVCIEQARLEVEYLFANRAESKMTGFDDPGVNWTDWHF